MDMSSYEVEREDLRELVKGHVEAPRYEMERHPALALLQVAPSMLPRREMAPPRVLASHDVERFLRKMSVTLH
jgi:hypothetical protein